MQMMGSLCIHTTPTNTPIGVRIRITWTGSADGTVASPYITVANLTERELPERDHPSGIFVMPIKGLCVGGVNPFCTSVGFIVFMRKGEGVDSKNFKYYREHVYRPYVQAKRYRAEGVPLSDDDWAITSILLPEVQLSSQWI